MPLLLLQCEAARVERDNGAVSQWLFPGDGSAWYLHLKLDYLSMPLAILISWLIAGGEYALQVPANRIGAHLC